MNQLKKVIKLVSLVVQSLEPREQYMVGMDVGMVGSASGPFYCGCFHLSPGWRSKVLQRVLDTAWGEGGVQGTQGREGTGISNK